MNEDIAKDSIVGETFKVFGGAIFYGVATLSAQCSFLSSPGLGILA